MTKVFLYPQYQEADNGEGGIRRVVEAQRKYLPEFGIEVVDSDAEADVIAAHAVLPPTYLRHFPEKVFVSHCHGMYWAELEWDSGHKGVNAAVLASIRQADAVTAPTHWVAQAVRRHSNRFVLEVPHGIDLDEWGDVMAAEGYVYWDKSRVDLTCDPHWMDLLANRMPNVRFVSTFGNQATNVTLTGKMPHSRAKDAMRRASVYLATAKETGQSISCLEALASGVPVVGFRHGGIAETVEHGVSGWLAEPGDVEGLMEGIVWAFDNRERASAAARELATKYTWKAAIARYAGLYDELLAQATAPRPLVSIVVRARNMEPWLAATLESVQQQSQDSWECIVVDDASDDATATIAESYAARDERFRVLHNATPAGPAEAHNCGFRVARGKYFMSLDADDRLAGPAVLDVLAGILEKERGLDGVYGNVEFEEPDGRRWHSGWPIEMDLEAWFARPQVGQPMPYCTLYRRRVWELGGGYRARCKTSEDQDFWLRATSYGFQVKYATQMDVLLYRIRPDSLTHNEGFADHRGWYPWSQGMDVVPAAARVSTSTPIVHSCDPPTVTVVIPVGPGHTQYVKDAVDSVDAQSFRLWECIVVNDSGEQLELPQWARVLETPAPGSGVSVARNIGFRAARAKLVLPLDADDFMQPECLMELLRAFKSGEGAPIVYSDFWENPAPDHERYKVFRTPDYDPRLLTKGAVHPVTALVPVQLWQQVGGFDEHMSAWEDWDFWFKCAVAGHPSRRVAAPLWTYRKDTGQRRADNFDNFPASKQEFEARWGGYWTGGKEMPGCSSCSGRNRTSNPMAGPPGGLMATADADAGGFVEIEHLGNQVATWKGVARGVPPYRFQAHARHYVHPADARHFLQFPDSFRAVGGEVGGVTLAPEQPVPAGAMSLHAGGRVLQPATAERAIATVPHSAGAGTPLGATEVPTSQLAAMPPNPNDPMAPIIERAMAGEILTDRAKAEDPPQPRTRRVAGTTPEAPNAPPDNGGGRRARGGKTGPFQSS